MCLLCREVSQIPLQRLVVDLLARQQVRNESTASCLRGVMGKRCPPISPNPIAPNLGLGLGNGIRRNGAEPRKRVQWILGITVNGDVQYTIIVLLVCNVQYNTIQYYNTLLLYYWCVMYNTIQYNITIQYYCIIGV